MVQIFCMPCIFKSRRSIHQMQMMKLKFISHGFYLGAELEVITFDHAIDGFLVVLVPILADWKHDICEVVWLTRVHFDQNAHEVVISKNALFASLELGVDVVAIPLDDIISIHLWKKMRRMNLIFQNLLAWAAIKKIDPGSV